MPVTEHAQEIAGDADYVELEVAVDGGPCVTCFTTRAAVDAYIAGTGHRLPLWMRAEDGTLTSTLLDMVRTLDGARARKKYVSET